MKMSELGEYILKSELFIFKMTRLYCLLEDTRFYREYWNETSHEVAKDILDLINDYESYSPIVTDFDYILENLYDTLSKMYGVKTHLENTILDFSTTSFGTRDERRKEMKEMLDGSMKTLREILKLVNNITTGQTKIEEFIDVENQK